MTKRTGVSFIDQQEDLINERKRDIGLRLKQVDPEREKWFTIAVACGSLLFGLLIWPLFNGEIDFVVAYLVSILPMVAFIVWVEPRNQLCLPGLLGFPGHKWDEAVRLDLDRYLRARMSPQATSRKPIGFGP